MSVSVRRFAPATPQAGIMDKADLCVILNPWAGRGQAERRLKKVLGGRRCELWPTSGPGHAEELAVLAAREGFGTVAAAGGDGTVHEVANGLLRAGRPEVVCGVIPLGSANDYAYSLDRMQRENGTGAARGVRPVDVGVVRDLAGRERYFINCLGLGFNGAVTMEARRIKRLQGLALYGLATLRALWYHFAAPVMDVVVDGKGRRVPTLLLSVAIAHREGGFMLAPNARLDDGLFDYLHVGDLSRWEVLRFLPRVATAGPPTDYPKVRIGRCREMAVQSDAPLVVHIDGEFFCRPENDVRAIQIGILPGALGVQTIGG
jgi:diacylglycerol kinase family enzyme